MATYWTTFRIEDRTVAGVGADQRRAALYDAIRSVASDKWWVEPTSFVLFASNNTISEIAGALEEAVSPQFDIVLVRDAEAKEARVIGPVDPDLHMLMPYVQAA